MKVKQKKTKKITTNWMPFNDHIRQPAYFISVSQKTSNIPMQRKISCRYPTNYATHKSPYIIIHYSDKIKRITKPSLCVYVFLSDKSKLCAISFLDHSMQTYVCHHSTVDNDVLVFSYTSLVATRLLLSDTVFPLIDYQFI